MHGCLFLMSDVRHQVVVSALGCSLVQRSPSECGVSECGVSECGVSEWDRNSSIMRRPCPSRADAPW
jgi:hypothetical protein